MIQEILQKYNGTRVLDDVRMGRRRYRLLRLPPVLLVNVRRFTHNKFLLEKNPTIVNFPIKNLDVAEHVPGEGAIVQWGLPWPLCSTIASLGSSLARV